MLLRAAHISLQFSDSDRQHTQDIKKVFERAADRRQAWITGTEAGPGAGNTGYQLVQVGRRHGYIPWVPSFQAGKGMAQYTDAWLAVREDLVRGKLLRGYKHVIPGSNQLRKEIDLDGKKWGPKGLVHVKFDTTYPRLGPLAIGAAHYLTGGRRPDSPYWEWNERLTRVIGDWAREEGKGNPLVFYGGDQNMADNRNNQPQGDTFMGQPLTSTWDELRKWENTGHGNIDVIASYNRDKRVKALRTNALNDREFHLHTDHFYVEATFTVDPIGR